MLCTLNYGAVEKSSMPTLCLSHAMTFNNINSLAVFAPSSNPFYGLHFGLHPSHKSQGTQIIKPVSWFSGVTGCGGGLSFKPTATPPPINWQVVARDLGLGSGLVKRA